MLVTEIIEASGIYCFPSADFQQEELICAFYRDRFQNQSTMRFQLQVSKMGGANPL